MNDNMTVEDRKRAFLDDLALITKQWGIVIAGCGCCGSPFLETVAEWRLEAKKWGNRFDPDQPCHYNAYAGFESLRYENIDQPKEKE
jgi:hypothetical protein